MSFNPFKFSGTDRKIFGLEIGPKHVFARALTGLLASTLLFGAQQGYSRLFGTTDSEGATEQTTALTVQSSYPTTTLFSFSQEPQIALSQLSNQLLARDASLISESTCGQFAVIVLDDSLKFFEWLDKSWVDHSNLITTDAFQAGTPRKVVSVDATRDATIDFVITFENPVEGQPFIGGVFAESDCAWNWEYFGGKDSLQTKSPMLLTYDEQNNILSGTQAGTISQIKVEYRYDPNQGEFISTALDPSTNYDDLSLVDSYMTDLASWQIGGFRSMFYKSNEQSPAQQYAYHLLIGRQSEFDTGMKETVPFGLVRDGDRYKLCIGTRCDYTMHDFVVENQKVSTFSISGIELSQIVHADTDIASTNQQCNDRNTCVTLRSVFHSYVTVYIGFEINCKDTLGEVAFVNSRLLTPSSETVSKTATAAPCRANGSRFWMVSYQTTSNPFGGSVVLRLKDDIGSFGFTFPIAG